MDEPIETIRNAMLASCKSLCSKEIKEIWVSYLVGRAYDF